MKTTKSDHPLSSYELNSYNGRIYIGDEWSVWDELQELHVWDL